MDEYLEILASLSVPEDYHPVDRYRDFRKVFLETEEGKRVLKQILSWGHLLKAYPLTKPVDPYRDERLEGGRNLALKIFAIMTVEPPVRQTTQATKSVEED